MTIRNSGRFFSFSSSFFIFIFVEYRNILDCQSFIITKFIITAVKLTVLILPWIKSEKLTFFVRLIAFSLDIIKKNKEKDKTKNLEFSKLRRTGLEKNWALQQQFEINLAVLWEIWVELRNMRKFQKVWAVQLEI